MIAKPEYFQSEEFQIRSQKLRELRELEIEPYPHHFTNPQSTKLIQGQYHQVETGHSEDAASGTTDEVCVAGRLVLFRPMGKNAFGHIQDETGRIQIMFNRDLTEVEGYQQKNEQDPSPIKFIEKKIDLGDIIGVQGNIFHTQKGELTIFVKKMTLLCKSLLPLAEKHSGLADKELRYRKRWLDLISNPEIKETFRTRTKIIRLIRQYLEEADFLEVENPVLQSVYGGAEAKPFETELHALHQKMFLRISLEIPLKKLIVGGIERVFEIGKVFRNEGIDRNHNPEFTLLEAYAAYWDYFQMMEFVEKLYEKIALELFGTTEIPYQMSENSQPIIIDVKTPWKRMTMKEAILTYGNLDVNKMNENEIRKQLLDSGHVDPAKIPNLSRGLLIAALFEVVAEPHLIQPHHIYDHPLDTTPLCKLHRDPKEKKEQFVERFESFILGSEMCNAYSELNDPELQRELLEKQAKRRESGDEEASPYDEEFVEAICQGMPPTAGVGIGIDRLVMLFTNCHSIRDVIYFPWMKPI